MTFFSASSDSCLVALKTRMLSLWSTHYSQNRLICCHTAKDIFSRYLTSVWVKTVKPEFEVCFRPVETFAKAFFWVTMCKAQGEGIICRDILIWLQHLDDTYICKSIWLCEFKHLKTCTPTGKFNVHFQNCFVFLFLFSYFFFFFGVLSWYSYSMEVVVISRVGQLFAVFKSHYVTSAFW